MSQLTQAPPQTQQQAISSSLIKSNLLQRAAITPIHNPTLQRCSNGVECPECRQKRIEREGTLQRAAVNSAPTNGVPPIVHDVLNSSGQPLDAGTRAFMEPRFGHDFSGVRVHSSTTPPLPARLAIGALHDRFEQEADTVADHVIHMSAPPTQSQYDFSSIRIHTDAKAAEAARQINAQAFTVGNHIVFDAGEYAPQTVSGQRLLAHELTHVVQQTGHMASGDKAQRSFIEQRLTSPHLQRKWRLDRVTPKNKVEVSESHGNGFKASVAVGKDQGPSGGVFGGATTWQEQGFPKQKEGGWAQVAHWMTKHFIFKNDHADDDFLQLSAVGQLAGRAMAEDLRYARAWAAVWGNVTERTKAIQTPPSQPLFEIEDGGISAATVEDLGLVEVELPIGENGSVNITIPLKKVSQGTPIPFSGSAHPAHGVPSTVDEVDVFLGARVEADADIQTSWTGTSPWISQNTNMSKANGLFELVGESRTAPGRTGVTAQKGKLSFPGDCKRNTLIAAANKDGCSTREGGSHTVVNKNGNQITTIPHTVKENNTCRSIIRVLNKECLQ